MFSVLAITHRWSGGVKNQLTTWEATSAVAIPDHQPPIAETATTRLR